MFKFYRNVLAAGVVALGLAACGDNVTVTNPLGSTPVVHSVTVVPASVTATVGQTGVTFVASVVADSGISSSVSWVSTNPAVATLASASSGAVTIVAAGQTTIVATSTGDPTKTGAGSLVVVALPPNITAFSVTPTNASIAVGGVLQASSSVSTAPGAPAATVAWASNNTAAATVSATGQITGVATGVATVTATATSGTQTATATVGVTVGSGPAGVISFSVVPSAMTLFATQSQQATATVTPGPGFTAAQFPVTWTSLAPTVATVNGTGLITAVAQGTAVITASIGTAPNTLTQSVVVTVAQGVSISITAVNQGASGPGSGCPGVVGAPVVLTNVACQIDVVMNLTAGLQPLDSLVVRLKQPSGFKTLAKQNYGNTIPSSGLVTLSINTANFVKVPATGTATVDLFNGPTTLLTQVYPHIASGGTVFNCQVGASDPSCAVVNSMVLNNTDGWAADIGKCETANTFPAPVCAAAVVGVNTPGGANTSTGGFAIAAGNGNVLTSGSTFWGGPSNSGMTVAELYPVVYNDNPGFPSGSSLNRCSNTLGNGLGCIASVTWTLGAPGLATTTPTFGTNCGYVAASTQTTQPFIQRFGSGTGTAINACAGYQNVTAIRDNITMAVSGSGIVNVAPLDGVNNPYPTVGVKNAASTLNTTLIPNTVVFGATPDSGRFDYTAPSVGTPSIVRTVPAVTGWVNASFSFAGFTITDAGVGPATATGRTWYTSVNCPTVVAVNVLLPNNLGSDINGTVACPTNFIGGANPTTSPWTVVASGTDLLGNGNTSAATATFGTDFTPPQIRWGLTDPQPLVKAYGSELATTSTVDSAFGASTGGAYAAKPIAGTNVFRAEYLDERSGFYNMGQPLAGVSAQVHQLSSANHIAPTGGCGALPLFGIGPVGAAFVTNPSCGLVSIAASQGTLEPFVRIDGWQPGIQVNIPTAEAYYGYKTDVSDAAGNVSAVLLQRVLVNTNMPFSTGLGIPAVLTSTTFNFLATASDSAEVSHQSLEIVYPNIPTRDSLRYSRVTLPLSGQFGCGVIAVTAYMDDCISSPYAGNIQPVWGNGAPVTPLTQIPYVRGIEIVDATAFGPAATNTAGTASFAAAKPTNVLVWAWNWGGAGLPAGFPAQPGNVAPTASPLITIPALNVQNGASIAAFNAANPTIAINYWRVITTVGATNQFGSTVTLRAQAAAPTNAPNPPFTRVDFYRLMDSNAISAGVAPTHWNYLGSAPGNVFSCAGLGVCASDQGTYRSWVYQLPSGSFVNAWNTVAAQATIASGNRIIAVGVVGTGDALSTLSTTMIP